MSLTSALGVAASGMTTSSRWAETVSNNIANAGNAGFARRDLSVTTDPSGTPRASVITRAVDSSLDAMYRGEVARTATQDAIATGLSPYTTLLGDSESTTTVLTRLTDFQNALDLLAVAPADSAQQRTTVTAAQDLAATLNRAGDALSDTAGDTAAAITGDVAAINASLSRLLAMNDRISGGIEGEARLALDDQIGSELDALAELTDFTLRSDTKGRMELFTTGGTQLLSGSSAEVLQFDAATGTLLAGEVDITPGRSGARGIADGALAGKIALHSDILPEMQAQLDQVAGALIDAMATADPSLAAGETGLFTDAGAALGDDIAPGLASRIAINDAVLPEAGGAHWRIRDGIGATEPGAPGDNSLARAFGDALSAATSFDESAGLGARSSLPDYVATLIASQNTTRVRAESSAAELAAGAVAVQSSRMAFSGVNIDDELQQLISIQQSYAANAKVLTVATEMIDTLLASA
ncbi:flagellar hook-associated protein FlgK [Marinovum sp.]|uniref:flagellar hook-associated protein FlgK n=1 Tax=Marinovum sp. TaxID=2024839 RepID=UPI002B270444|nr:flagellar hook-associated protein FlgK [Marinovum sp.]